MSKVQMKLERKKFECEKAQREHLEALLGGLQDRFHEGHKITADDLDEAMSSSGEHWHEVWGAYEKKQKSSPLDINL